MRRRARHLLRNAGTKAALCCVGVPPEGRGEEMGLRDEKEKSFITAIREKTGLIGRKVIVSILDFFFFKSVVL